MSFHDDFGRLACARKVARVAYVEGSVFHHVSSRSCLCPASLVQRCVCRSSGTVNALYRPCWDEPDQYDPVKVGRKGCRCSDCLSSAHGQATHLHNLESVGRSFTVTKVPDSDGPHSSKDRLREDSAKATSKRRLNPQSSSLGSSSRSTAVTDTGRLPGECAKAFGGQVIVNNVFRSCPGHFRWHRMISIYACRPWNWRSFASLSRTVASKQYGRTR